MGELVQPGEKNKTPKSFSIACVNCGAIGRWDLRTDTERRDIEYEIKDVFCTACQKSADIDDDTIVFTCD